MLAVALTGAPAVFAQGRGGGAWTTGSGDAQRTASVRTDPRISVGSMQKPGFQFLWKRKLDNQPAQLNSLTQPIILPNIIAYKGFKALVFVGGSADVVYSIDYDLNRMFWQQKLPTAAKAAGTPACPGGLTAITKVTQATPPATAAARGARGAGGGGGARGPQIANGRGGNDNVFAISSGGTIHIMNPQIGTDQIPPVKFLNPGANVVGSILVDTFLYAATTGNCGGNANGVYAVNLASEPGSVISTTVSEPKTVVSWDAKGAAIAGTAAPTFGTDGTIYIATGGGSSPVANAIVALESKTLTQKDWFSAGSPFVSHPIVFQYKGKDLVVAANSDGRLYVLDSAAIGGADHKTPVARSAPFIGGMPEQVGLAAWQDAAGTRWILATSAGSPRAETKFAMHNGAVSKGALVAFTVVDENGAPSLSPQWVSRDLASPTTPAVVNGVVFALSSGLSTDKGTAAQRAKKSVPAVLYALDAATGKELWTSGTTMTSFVHGIGPSAGDGQVYVVTYDGTLYAFGMPMER
jgi:outer membrane protein assembly factor BamB